MKKKNAATTASIAQHVDAVESVSHSVRKKSRSTQSLVSLTAGELTLKVDTKTGKPTSLTVHGEECLAAVDSYFCRFQTRNIVGNPRCLSDRNAASIVVKQPRASEIQVKLRFDRTYFPKGHFEVVVRIRAQANGDMTWNVTFNNSTDEYLEWIECPGLLLKDDLVNDGGAASLFWPAQEGALVESVAARNASWMKYRGLGYPTPGWGGYYPGPTQMQFMAYMRHGKGLYIAAHDRQGNTKNIEYESAHGAIRPEFVHFCSASTAKKFELDYPMVMKAFRGDWHDAADIYREWAEASISILPPKVPKNSRIPEWVTDSPLVVTYPIRGIGHHAGKTEPNEYCPPPKALPALQKLADAMDTKMLVLLMHWEGTAPWSPPYVWPPLGGEAAMRRFAKELKKDGHRLGLYCSGTGWTSYSSTGSNTYNRADEFKKKRLDRFMCTGPRNEMFSHVCNDDSIRWGYDICSATDFAVKVMTEETVKMAKAGVDYIQLFDQNLGCSSYMCYSPNHGHPPGPGPWQRESMTKLLRNITGTLRKKGLPTVLGCEAAAAEGYIAELPVNDLRAMLGWEVGVPVPAYSYVYHEYTGNFHGNQCGILEMLDEEKSPLNYFQRAAYAFTGGDMLTAILKDAGQIHWGWCVKWDVKPPPQDRVINFTKDLLAWRRNQASPFLVYGRMLKPFPIEGVAIETIHMKRPVTFTSPAIMTSRWQAQDGREAQVLVNWTDRPQTGRLTLDRARSFTITQSDRSEPKHGKGREIPIAMQPFSVGIVEYQA